MIIASLYYLLSFLLLFFLLLPFIQVLFSRWRKEKPKAPAGRVPDFAIIITAYHNLRITQPLLDSLAQMHYERYHVYLVADRCDPAVLDSRDEKLTVFYPKPALDLKIRSIIYAADRFQKKHDYILVLDADNLVHPDFLSEINHYINWGFPAVQGQRVAKNLNSFYACADATGEYYKNYVERYLPFLLGSSAVISGSGMAVKADLYLAYLASSEIQEGQMRSRKMLQEDKILQNFLVRQNRRIAFAKEAILYDEKVTTGKAVETQRSRWLYSYFQNILNALDLLKRGLFRLSFNQFFFGLITINLPLFVQLFVGLLLALLGFWIDPVVPLLLLSGLLIFAVNLLWVLHLSNVPSAIWSNLWRIPLFIWRQMMALLKMSDPEKNFRPTVHNQEVDLKEIVGSISKTNNPEVKKADNDA